MTDIVTRLRQGRTVGTDLRWAVTEIHRDAADRIEQLEAALERIARSGDYPSGGATLTSPDGDRHADAILTARAALGRTP